MHTQRSLWFWECTAFLASKTIQWSHKKSNDKSNDSQSECPPHFWAQMSSSAERTTNARESKFNPSFYTPRPDVYSFLEAIKNVQLGTQIRIQTSNYTPKKTISVGEKQIRFINDNIMKYQTGLNDGFDFVKTKRFTNQPKNNE